MTSFQPDARQMPQGDPADPRDPAGAGARLEIDDAAIRDWARKIRQIEALKAEMRPARETGLALDDLHRLRALGMDSAERNERQASGTMTVRERDAAVPGDTGLRFTRIARAVRQIIVMEQELMGLRPVPTPRTGAARPAPAAASAESPTSTAAASGNTGAGEAPEPNDLRDRSDLRDRPDTHDYDDHDDYDRGPYEQVLERVLTTLGATVKRPRQAPARPEDRPEDRPEERPGDRRPEQPGWQPRARPAGPDHAPFDGPGWDDDDGATPVATEVRERAPPW
jgi:hypothetical protein